MEAKYLQYFLEFYKKYITRNIANTKEILNTHLSQEQKVFNGNHCKTLAYKYRKNFQCMVDTTKTTNIWQLAAACRS